MGAGHFASKEGSVWQSRLDKFILNSRQLHLITADKVNHTKPSVKYIPGVRNHHQLIFEPGTKGLR